MSWTPSPMLQRKRQTLLLICWTPPLLLSYPDGKLKQDRAAYFALPLRSLSLSSLHCCPRLPCSNSKLWHMRRQCFSAIFLRVCVGGSNVQGVSLLQYVQYCTTGLHNSDDSNDAERGRKMMWGGGGCTELSVQNKPICLPIPVFATPPTAHKIYHT